MYGLYSDMDASIYGKMVIHECGDPPDPPEPCEKIEHLANGGFEEGSMNHWEKTSGTDTWFSNQPHGSTPAGEVPYEGNWRVYMNPADHSNPAASQNVDISTADFALSWGILPHSGSFPRIVKVTAYDASNNPIIDSNGKNVELLYSMVGDSSGHLGYKLYFDIPTRNPNTGLGAWDYFERDFAEDYQNAGGNPSDFNSAAYVKVTFQARDGSGGTSWDAFSLFTCVTNESPVADANGPYSGDEGTPISLDGTGSYDLDGTIVSHEWDLDNDGEYDDATGVSPSFIWSDNGLYTVDLKVADDDGEIDTDTAEIMVNNVAPTITSITGPMTPVPINEETSLDVSFTDPGILDTHSASVDWEDSTPIAPEAAISPVNLKHIYTEAGVYTATVTITDDDGDSDTRSYEYYIVVYDPSGGFVTGGGWIDSPVGAYLPDPSLTGKATFGFVSKYKKVATEPTGNTEFVFRTADLNFHSSTYEWLVIAGSKAMFKGEGTINGMGEYKFIITAIDSDTDSFRIKIWTEDEFGVEAVVYDNELEEGDYSDTATDLGGGSIVIHKAKK
jgi:PKD repeat protein